MTDPPGDPNILAGSFQVRLVPPVPASGTPGYTAVVGKVYDGASPSQLLWEKAAQSGDCQLLTPRVPFCNTPCGGSAVCVENDTCQAYPKSQSVGTVQVQGVRTAAGATEFSRDPVVNNYQPPVSAELPYPAFSEGGTIRFDAAGGVYSAFSLQARGIAPLQLLNDTITLQQDQPVNLSWTAPGQADLSKIHVKLDISHHGGTRGMLECDAADTGSLQLPAALVTQLLNLGVAGYPSVVVTRKAVGSTTIVPGRVDLIVSSEVEHAVEIPGLVSCSDDSQCPGGQTCQTDLTCG
ncbi:hypothetical protein [Hyalangium minutum]|uniref:Uncharacterized protein n=1 Tax=Hyalangium minutum TaxID=394096 RepID=A0A085VZE0_9BACT|nr:hypothetical protein [Hyalangium minutum]KFE60803.1 hypothetical protein DB31_4716 [Hyalangium minutum]